jgi:ribulose bisphosphate carboxylase small subunit
MAFYISPRFLDKLAIHLVKNYLNLPQVKVPLILGVHGRKGEGKTFQCQLVFEQMGVVPVMMSGGELESPDAGDPARLLRLRYREAAELVKVRGKMAVLVINDLDAGAGRVDQYTQYTVNTQLVNATLMNIADNPTNVQLPGSYDAEPIQRIPIVVTGNDFSTLYQPLVRDGRMEKFFWEPDRADRIGIVSGIFAVDRLAQADVAALVDQFADQSIDFFGAMRSRLYDEQIRQLIHHVGIDRVAQRIVNSTEAPPEFRPPDFSLPHLMEVGHQLIREQAHLRELRLAEEYNKFLYNRRLGDTTPTVQPKQETIALSQPSSTSNGDTLGQQIASGTFFRAYRPNFPAADGETSPPGQPSSTRLTPNIVTEVNQILGQGYRLGIEFVDDRRFRTNAWSCYGSFSGDAAEALRALDTCLEQHAGDYIRLVGVNPQDRRRIVETIIQRPFNKATRPRS